MRVVRRVWSTVESWWRDERDLIVIAAALSVGLIIMLQIAGWLH